MNERDESERLSVLWSGYDSTTYQMYIQPLEENRPRARWDRLRAEITTEIESREREQTLALLEALRNARETMGDSWGYSPGDNDCGCTPDDMCAGHYAVDNIETVLASYEAAHALQVAHEEVKGG